MSVYCRSRGSRSRRSSNSRSSSKTRALRLAAEKARLALVFAEEENQRKVEAEIKILELERKQRELLRRREVEEEPLKGTFRLESLKTEADRKLAEARKIAAIMELEPKIAEDMDSESSNNETTSMQLTPVDNALPSRSSTFHPPLTTVTTPALPSTPKASASSAHTPAVSASSTVITLSLGPQAISSLTSLTPPYPTISSEPSLPTPAFARVTLTPARHPQISASLSASTSGPELPGSSLSPGASPYSPLPIKRSSSVPACIKATVTSVHSPGTGVLPSVTGNNSSPLVMNSLPPWTLRYPAPSVYPGMNIPPASSAHDEVLTMVASAVKDISLKQQRQTTKVSRPSSSKGLVAHQLSSRCSSNVLTAL